MQGKSLRNIVGIALMLTLVAGSVTGCVPETSPVDGEAVVDVAVADLATRTWVRDVSLAQGAAKRNTGSYIEDVNSLGIEVPVDEVEKVKVVANDDEYVVVALSRSGKVYTATSQGDYGEYRNVRAYDDWMSPFELDKPVL